MKGYAQVPRYWTLLFKVIDGFCDFINVSIDFHFRPDLGEFSIGSNQEGRPLDAHRFLSIHVLLHPDAVLLTNHMIGVGKQGKVQLIFGSKLLVGCDIVSADAKDSCFQFFET